MKLNIDDAVRMIRERGKEMQASNNPENFAWLEGAYLVLVADGRQGIAKGLAMLRSIVVVLLFAGGMGWPVVAFCLTEAKSVWVFAAFTGIVTVMAAVSIDDRRGVPPIWWMVGAERPARDPNTTPLWRCIAEPLAIWAGIFAVLYVVGTLVHLAVR